MSTFDEVVAGIIKWQAVQFPNATVDSVISHIEKEYEELKKNPEDKEEVPDIVFLIISLCTLQGYDLRELCEKKLEINLAREWDKPDSKGVVEHVRQPYIDEEGKSHSSISWNKENNLDDSYIRMRLTGELPG